MQPSVAAATHTSPDFLAVQLGEADPRVADAARSLFTARGFRPVVRTDDLDLRPASGCLLTRLGPIDAELLVTVGSDGASRLPLTGLDPAWLERAVETGQAAVLLVGSAVHEGAITQADLRSDVDAGVVLSALVPCADHE